MFQVLFTLLVAQLSHHIFAEDRQSRHSESLPSTFLEPPPISRSYTPTAAKPSPRFQRSKYMPLKGYRQAKVPVLNPTSITSVARDFSYYDLQCNPCNSIPWIPIISFAYPNVKPVQELQNQYENIAYNPFKNTLNQLSPNLGSPTNVAAPMYPLYLGQPVYQQQPQNQEWPTAINYPHVFSPSRQPGADQYNPLLGAHNSEPTQNIDDIGLSQWINEAKPAPLFQYTHSIDYPTQYTQTPTFDLPHQIPESALPIPEITFPTGLSQYATSSDSLNDVPHHLDDNKYASSEDKISFTNNGTVKDSKQLRSQRNGENITSLIEYLTPPSVSSGNEWVQKVGRPDIELRPLEDWAFIKAIEPKNEKRKKQIQIVIPYYVNKIKPEPKSLQENATKWTNDLKKHFKSSHISTTVLPIVRYLKGNMTDKQQNRMDWLKLRKAIDSWTVERFSNHKYNSSTHIHSISSTLHPEKEISDDYLQNSLDYQQESEIRNQFNEIQNRVSSGVKETRSTTENELPSWKTLPVAVHPGTNEKVYIVTPLPLTNYNFSSNDIASKNSN